MAKAMPGASMPHRIRLLALGLLLATALVACRSRSRGGYARPSRATARAANLLTTQSSRQSQSLPVFRHPPHDSALSVYNNPTYGVTFRYPRNYLLKEELHPDDDAYLVEKRRALEAAQPGVIVVVTLLIPDDAYPNTTFVGGHLQLAVNPHATFASCRAFLAPPDSAAPGAAGGILEETTLQGMTLYWRDGGSLAEPTARANREYVGFANGTCYEFFLEAASSSAVYSGVPVAPADFGKILRPLEKAVLSLQARPPSAPPAQ